MCQEVEVNNWHQMLTGMWRMLLACMLTDTCRLCKTIKLEVHVSSDIGKDLIDICWPHGCSSSIAYLWANWFDSWHDDVIVWHCVHLGPGHRLWWI